MKGSGPAPDLFLCTHNSARSQMAEGFLRSMAGDRFYIASAGTEATGVHPLAVKAMAQVGVDLHGHASKTVGQFLEEPWDYVITVCDAANEACPVFPKKTTGTEDERLELFQPVRDQIKRRLSDWIIRVRPKEGPRPRQRAPRSRFLL